MQYNCPNDNTLFSKISFTTESNSVLEGHQCDECGGVFFKDWHALYQPAFANLESALSEPNLEKFHSVTVTAASVRSCPQCNLLMRPLIDEHLPRDLQIERCDECGGLWMNYGKEKVLRAGMRVMSWNRPRPHSNFGGMVGDYLFQKLSRFVSAPTVNYFSFLPVSRDDFSESYSSIPPSGTITILDAIGQKLFGFKSIKHIRTFQERVIQSTTE